MKGLGTEDRRQATIVVGDSSGCKPARLGVRGQPPLGGHTALVLRRGWGAPKATGLFLLLSLQERNRPKSESKERDERLMGDTQEEEKTEKLGRWGGGDLVR